MSESHEFNATTVQEAVTKASKKLGVPEEEIDYAVLDDGSPGFLGIGARDARISVSPVDDSSVEYLEAEETPPTTEENVQEPDTQTKEVDPDDGEIDPTDDQELHKPALVSEDLLSEVKTFTTETVEKMGFEARVDVYDTDEFIAVDVSPGDPGLFIGQKGETIDSLQHLINISVYKDREFVKRIVLDSEGYRQRRIEAVEGMAHRMARRASREGRNIQLPPMSSSERRIVHTYLKDNPRVSTSSEGTGGNRRVNISPS